MSIRRTATTTLRCDVKGCHASVHWGAYVPKARVEHVAHSQRGWRKDKTGRNICPAHPKGTSR